MIFEVSFGHWKWNFWWIRWMVFWTHILCVHHWCSILESLIHHFWKGKRKIQRWDASRSKVSLSDDSLTRWHFEEDLSFLASYSKHVAGQSVTQTIRWFKGISKFLVYARWNHHKSFEHRVAAPLTFWVPDIFKAWNQNLVMKYEPSDWYFKYTVS